MMTKDPNISSSRDRNACMPNKSPRTYPTQLSWVDSLKDNSQAHDSI